jgi:hypothetical protein
MNKSGFRTPKTSQQLNARGSELWKLCWPSCGIHMESIWSMFCPRVVEIEPINSVEKSSTADQPVFQTRIDWVAYGYFCLVYQYLFFEKESLLSFNFSELSHHWYDFDRLSFFIQFSLELGSVAERLKGWLRRLNSADVDEIEDIHRSFLGSSFSNAWGNWWWFQRKFRTRETRFGPTWRRL